MGKINEVNSVIIIKREFGGYFINVGHSNTPDKKQLKIIRDFIDSLEIQIRKLNDKLC